MKTEIIHIGKRSQFKNMLVSSVTFKPFIDFLHNGVDQGPALKVPYFKWLLKKFAKQPELSETIPLEKLKDYSEILELVSSCLLPMAAEENILWALTSPLAPEIFYSTDALYDMMHYLKTPSPLDPTARNADLEAEILLHEIQYGQLLEKIYHQPFLKRKDWIKKFRDPKTGLDKYYQVSIDNRFLELRPTKELPKFDCAPLLPSSVWGEEFKKIKKTLPLTEFEARGFSVISMREVTAEQAVEEIGKRIVDQTMADPIGFFHEINHLLQTVIGSPEFQFGIVPFLTINDRPALVYENFPFSIIIQACWHYEISKKEFLSLRNDFVKEPKIIVWSAGTKENNLPELISKALIHAGIGTYLLFPIFHNKKISGIFEVSTKSGQNMITEAQLLKLRPALPLVAQIIQNMIARFRLNIDEVIKEKFTSIQPSVQWKFNETAWHYFRDHVAEDRNDPIETIQFKDLHPLYGAVDIRNSTVLRNQALSKDYTIQLNLLIELLNNLEVGGRPEVDRALKTANNWLDIIHEPLSTQQEIRINEFFTMDVRNVLENLLQHDPGSSDLIQHYNAAIDEESGIAFENRRHLESAIQDLNRVIEDFYETASADIQKIYPCYFEKFRTDGVEYDIYVGQSIAPKTPFHKDHLERIRSWQLESMIKLTHLTEQLIPEMAYPLQTTQLIFIHPLTIDITFRKDERRFDVEGAYNIRYHIVKKRIDKAQVLETGERLTQPGKIALVYFNDRDTEDYLRFIEHFQEQGLLKKDLEELELEPLQGVNGLKALRVGIVEKTLIPILI